MACGATWNIQRNRYEFNSNCNLSTISRVPLVCNSNQFSMVAYDKNNQIGHICLTPTNNNNNNMETCVNQQGKVIACCKDAYGNTKPCATVKQAEKVNVNNGNVTYSSGQTTLDKILATVLSAAALAKGAGYVPTTTIPQNQVDYSQYQQQYPQYNQVATENTGTGAQIESLIQNNKGLIIVAGVAFVLLQMNPLGRKK